MYFDYNTDGHNNHMVTPNSSGNIQETKNADKECNNRTCSFKELRAFSSGTTGIGHLSPLKKLNL